MILNVGGYAGSGYKDENNECGRAVRLARAKEGNAAQKAARRRAAEPFRR